jgi:hypothetical protein
MLNTIYKIMAKAVNVFPTANSQNFKQQINNIPPYRRHPK